MPLRRPLHACRPRVESMESLCLLSASPLHHPAAIVHDASVVDLKPTQVGKDAFAYIAQASPHFARTDVQISLLTADSSDRTVKGLATESYGVKFLGTVKATVQFKTSLDAPRAGDVKFTVSRVNSFISAGERKKIALAVVKFLQKDHDAIAAQLPSD